ncbi:kinase-like protein [Myriangium duriaei CBS 260.36]|uniref:Kinase-like protein n=1 Tax=Myriangium duriaei CBS 260.36 TaxID=1168546 RepID=A0A9P4IXQ7_9PEZI|nr:kinase-like protein [Myriangium duriaei CBS 260.36]
MAPSTETFLQGDLLPASEVCNDDAIVAFCRPHNGRRKHLFKGHSTRVTVLNDHLVVKHGHIGPLEVRNQRWAYEHIDQSKVRIPRVVHTFGRDGRGYFIMEWLKDMREATLDDIPAVVKAVEHMHSVLAPDQDAPGPVGGGPAGMMFGDDDEVVFRDKLDLQRFINHRRRLKRSNICLDDAKLVLVHFDLAPRNIGILPDGTVCFLDWAAAGFYPHWFDIGQMRAYSDILPGSNEFKDELARQLQVSHPLTETERQYMWTFEVAILNCDIYGFAPWDSKNPLKDDDHHISNELSSSVPEIDFSAIVAPPPLPPSSGLPPIDLLSQDYCSIPYSRSSSTCSMKTISDPGEMETATAHCNRLAEGDGADLNQ